MRLLFVDDEPLILQGLRRMLFDMEDEWDIMTAGSGAEALDMLATTDVDVVVSDMRMPGMDGGQLLRHVKSLHPNAVRIVLSGQTDEESTNKAVPIAHQFLSKPFDPQLFEDLVKQTVELNDMLRDPKLRHTLQTIKALPPAPRTFQELAGAVADESIGSRAIATIIQRDPGLSAKLLQLANSSFYARRMETTDIIGAIMHLGVNTIRNLVLGIELFDSASDFGRAAGDRVEAMQDHALGMAMAADLVAQGTIYAKEGFSLGLLLDVGQLALAMATPDWFAWRDEAEQTGVELTEIEQRKLGVTHAEAGAFLLGIWGLPYYLVEAVATHHRLQAGMRKGLNPAAIAAIAVSLVDGPRLDDDWVATVGVSEKIGAWREAFGQ
jgi:HD-like signal output (HDOD) protein